VRRAVPLAVAVAVLVTAGCGGNDITYSLTKTRACLRGQGVKISAVPRSDFVASTATGGSFRADLDSGNFVTVVFGETDDDAEQIDKAYQRFAFPNVRQGLPDVLRTSHNAIMLWHEHPEPADEQAVLGCLK
jgi:hypothetical protein